MSDPVIGQPREHRARTLSDLEVERWLDRRATELNGDWTMTKLAGLSRANDKAERLRTLALLAPTDELRLEHESENLYAATAIKVSTMSGAVLGYLVPDVAEDVYRDRRRGSLVRCFLFRIRWDAAGHVSAVQLAIMRWSLR